MDYKQRKIFEKILDKFSLSYNNIFIQHRNLNEFRSFDIERINPNHRIQLYGKLRKKYINDNKPNKIIKVGEILLCFMPVFLIQSIYLIFIYQLLASLFLTYILIDCIILNDFQELIYAYWYKLNNVLHYERIPINI